MSHLGRRNHRSKFHENVRALRALDRHRWSGPAMVSSGDQGGKSVLRLEQFKTSNEPDVRVYLVKGNNASDNAVIKEGAFVDLGALKVKEPLPGTLLDLEHPIFTSARDHHGVGHDGHFDPQGIERRSDAPSVDGLDARNPSL